MEELDAKKIPTNLILPQEKEKENYYFCPFCNKIPRIKLDKEGLVNIRCYCKNRYLKDIIDPLDVFLKGISKKKEKPNCDNSHTKAKKAELFCYDCNKYFCSACAQSIHTKLYDTHKAVKSENGLLTQFFCEDDKCKAGVIAGYYCNKCHLYLCTKCEGRHYKSHKDDIVDLYFEFQDNIFAEEYRSLIVTSYFKLKQKTVAYENFLKKLEESIKKCRDLLKKKEKEDEKSIKFFKTILATYNDNTRALDYNIKNNFIINNPIQYSEERDIDFKYKFNSFFNFDNLKIEFKELPIVQDEEAVKLDEEEPNKDPNYDHYNDNLISPVASQNIVNFNIKESSKIFDQNNIPEKILIKNEHNENYIYCLLVSKKGQLLSGSQDKTIGIYNFNNEQNSFEYFNKLEGHSDAILSLSQTKSENIILSSSMDNTIKLWDLDNLNCTATISGHEGGVNKVISSSNDKIISCSFDKSIKIWNSSTFNLEETLLGHSDCVWCVLELKDKRLVSGSYDSSIMFWENVSNKGFFLQKNLIINDVECLDTNCMYYAEEDDKLFVGGSGVINVICLKTNKVIKSIKQGINHINIGSISQFNHDAIIVGVKNENEQIFYYDKEFNLKGQLKSDFKNWITCTISFKEDMFITSDHKGNIILWKY